MARCGGGGTITSATSAVHRRRHLDEAAEARGLKKGLVIEEALLHYLHALRELPADVIVPTRLALTQDAAREVARLLAQPRSPTPGMIEMMTGEAAEDVPG